MMNRLNYTHSDEKQVLQWYAVHTKYKCEKYVVESLVKKNITAYTPLLTTTKQYTRKIVKREIPLINCYVFVHIDLADMVKVLQTEYVYSFLRIGKEISPVQQDEINILKRITGDYQDIVLEDFSYVEGMPVEIISGNMTGVKGILLEKKGNHNFVVELQSLSYQLKINVDPSILKPLRKVAEGLIV